MVSMQDDGILKRSIEMIERCNHEFGEATLSQEEGGVHIALCLVMDEHVRQFSNP